MKSLVLVAVGVLASGTVLADSPLADLIQDGRRDAAIELIEKGADVNAAQGDGATPLHWAAYKIDLELVQHVAGSRRKTRRREPLRLEPAG